MAPVGRARLRRGSPARAPDPALALRRLVPLVPRDGRDQLLGPARHRARQRALRADPRRQRPQPRREPSLQHGRLAHDGVPHRQRRDPSPARPTCRPARWCGRWSGSASSSRPIAWRCSRWRRASTPTPPTPRPPSRRSAERRPGHVARGFRRRSRRARRHPGRDRAAGRARLRPAARRAGRRPQVPAGRRVRLRARLRAAARGRRRGARGASRERAAHAGARRTRWSARR